MHVVGRNDPCPCGSGKKFKKCCEDKVKHKKFEATIITQGDPLLNKAKKIGTHFFHQKPLENLPQEEVSPPPNTEL